MRIHRRHAQMMTDEMMTNEMIVDVIMTDCAERRL